MNQVFVKVKKAFPIIGVVATVLFIVLLFAFKDKLNQMALTAVKAQAGAEITTSASVFVDSAFNYSKNGLSYEITFLEFGATGCSTCRQMETVMEEVKKQYPEVVKVVFLNILKPENQAMMKYFGVAAIPTQILLTKEGKEIFRHSGYIPIDQLLTEINRRRE
ncbi:MAG: thioredoxin family protein [Salinivirgaceae bacterium]